MGSYYDISLDHAIVEVYDAAHRIHGELGLAPETFRAHLITTIRERLDSLSSRGSRAVDFVQALHTGDLYLSLACANGSNAAWERFNTLYGKYVKDLARAISVRREAANEIADNILVDLFLPDRSGRSRIASYEGRSSLATWLRVIVSHRMSNERVRLYNNAEDVELISDVADESALHKIDASFRACRYGPIIGECLRHSCNCLSDQERLIILLRYDEGLQLGQIARVLGVHQSTVTRQIERVCKKWHKEVISILATKYGLDDDSINECREDILENPSYSILSGLGASRVVH